MGLQAMEQKILSSLADQTTLQKAAQSTDKQTQSMQVCSRTLRESCDADVRTRGGGGARARG